MWIIYGLMSALFAAISSILDKIGVAKIDSNLATAIRTSVIVLITWSIVFITRTQHQMTKMDAKSWIVLLISGILTGLSWLTYFKAMSLARASKVVPLNRISVVITIVLAAIFLGEGITAKSAVGGVLIMVGTVLLVL